ncbi:hypothetical protein P60_gp52 [Synechococcus phage P60]|uniref:Uncharacterized protein n=1 Tax=Synechococcus phage P60 TaxID=2905923 RepID=Q8W6Y0_9CAUD|nr:hypothetical protein P60_gp52 [Synechococcus phage P60]AAL73299.1 hypothetical protein P60_gp52 [Synechococcus phage P60]
MDSNTLKFGQLAALTSFTGQQQATNQFIDAAITNEVQTASLNNLSLGVEAAYEPAKLGQGTQQPMEGIRNQYRRYQEEMYTNKHYGVESIDKANLIDYKKKVDRMVEMKYLPESVKYPKIKEERIKNHNYSLEERENASGFGGL